MSAQQSPYAASTGSYDDDVTGWTGWVFFAGIMLVMAGIFQGIAGLTALFKDEVYLVRDNGLVWSIDYTAWGWIHVGIALFLLVGGFSLMAGNMFGRIIGVLAAMLSMTANIVFISAYPAWSLAVIAIDVLVIWAIVVHGRELKLD